MITHNYSGKSLLELREQFGVGPSGFYGNEWWLNEPFAKEKPEAGTYELDLSYELVNLTFAEQQKKLKKGFEVTHPAIIAEAVLTHYMNIKKRLIKNCWLRTQSVASDGHRVGVGVNSDGVVVSNWYDRPDDGIGLASARKSQKKIEPGNLDTETLNLDGKILEIDGKKYKLKCLPFSQKEKQDKYLGHE